MMDKDKQVMRTKKRYAVPAGTTFLILVIAGIVPSACEAVPSPIASKLRNYDIGYVERRLVKRSLYDAHLGNEKRFEQLHLVAFGRRFRFTVHPSEGLIHPNFAAFVEKDDSERVQLKIDADDFSHGFVEGYENSDVRLAYETPDSIIGVADLRDGDPIMFEPAWRHDPEQPENATLVFRVSDIILKPSNQSVCGSVKPEMLTSPNMALHNPFLPLSRQKRQFGIDSFGGGDAARHARSTLPITPHNNRCPMKLVADHRFFNDMAGRRDASAVKYLINLMDRVNAIYTSTVFNGFTNMGFMVKEIVIKTTPSTERGHYNAPNPPLGRFWNVEDLLRAFTEREGSNQFCLVHLFTSQSFEGGVLGLGYIAGAKFSDRGGICSPASSSNTAGTVTRIFYNTALSTMKSTVGDAVITREADIVTAHELGHNWGSPHDPVRPLDCNPSQSEGGAFIMHTYSVSGYDPNNKMFSQCSIDYIKPVLDAKHELCFQPQRSSYCGNQRVEEGERCDAGIVTETQGEDACCDRQCRLRPTAQCSPHNSLCCTSACSFAPRGTECQAPGHCLRSVTCTGRGGECPAAEPKPNGTPCLDEGQCQNGTCIPYCETLGLRPCLCEQKDLQCVRCCRENSRGARCKPVGADQRGQATRQLKAGTPCISGVCDQQGDCQKETADFVSLLWKIAERYDTNGFWRFIEDNLVLSIVVLTLLFWVPVSVLVCRCDAAKVKQISNDYQWDDADYVLTQQGVQSAKQYAHAVDSALSQLNHL